MCQKDGINKMPLPGSPKKFHIIKCMILDKLGFYLLELRTYFKAFFRVLSIDNIHNRHIYVLKSHFDTKKYLIFLPQYQPCKMYYTEKSQVPIFGALTYYLDTCLSKDSFLKTLLDADNLTILKYS